jgi:hypothetical protein
VAGIASCVVVAALGGAPVAEGSPPPGKVSFSTPTQFPKFRPDVYDYVVRCNDGPVTVNGHASGGWRLAIGNQTFHTGDFSQNVPMRTGKAFTATAKNGPDVYRYHVRCLPDDFPTYTFHRSAAVAPGYFAATHDFTDLASQYGMIFDDHGVPIWWIHTPIWDPRVLPSGQMLWFDDSPSSGEWGIHRLDGSLVRTLNPVGVQANAHDLQILPNGDYLTGATIKRSHVDTSAYGGSSDADVNNTELQQVSPTGGLVWDWKSWDHFSLAETGHRWPWAINHGYDIEHWNSIEPDGNSVIASFRHLDAVYKIRKSTGDIVWKLGGTKTPETLKVKGDPRGAPLGAQHDARLLPGGALTVFDNATNLDNHKPRVVRYRIDEAARTATLVQSITDPAVPDSNCCGSARRVAGGDWLVDWGRPGPIAGYAPDGTRTFLLTFDSGFSYRAEPVPPGAVSASDLRQAMDAMCAAGCS